MTTTEKLIVLEELVEDVDVDDTELDEAGKEALTAGLQEVHCLLVEALEKVGVSYATNHGRGE